MLIGVLNYVILLIYSGGRKMRNHINPFDPQTVGMEEAYLNELSLDRTIERLEYADRELDRLIDTLKTEERTNYENTTTKHI